jgi:coenzyme F420 hydrogenase subunit beta
MKSKPLAENDNHADNIGMVFGLFCGWGLDWEGLRNLTAQHADPAQVSHMDIPPSKYHSLELRENGETVSVNLDEVTPLVRSGCHYCTDMTAEFADLSVGGARSADGWDVDKGWNQVIVRSEKGQQLLDLAREKGVLEFKEPPETGVDKLKGASLGKKRTGVKNLREMTGGSLGYLDPSAGLFENL